MLKTTDLQRLKELFEVKHFIKGEVIFPQGQMARWCICCNKRHGSSEKET